MSIKNSIRQILIGMGTSGLRGASETMPLPSWSGTSSLQRTVYLSKPLNCGKWRIKSAPHPSSYEGVISAVVIQGQDATGKQTLLDRKEILGAGNPNLQYWNGLTELCGDFQSDLNLVSITVMASVYNNRLPPGEFDFEVWGQANAGGG